MLRQPHKTENKMKFVVFLTHLLISLASIAATPIDGLYSNFFGGYLYVPPNVDQYYGNNLVNGTKYQGGFDGGGSFGYKSNPMRYEGEITYLKANINQFNINNIPITHVSGYNDAIFGMANIFYDFPTMNPILQPFIGAGIGYGWVQTQLHTSGPLDLTAFSASNSTFAYQATGGVTFNFADNYALNLGYRYIGTSRLSNFGQMFQAHMANLGATYRFDGSNYK